MQRGDCYAGATPPLYPCTMAKERLVGSYLIRLTEDDGGTRVRLHDLKTGVVLEFETWAAAWSYVDEAVASGDAHE